MGAPGLPDFGKPPDWPEGIDSVPWTVTSLGFRLLNSQVSQHRRDLGHPAISLLPEEVFDRLFEHCRLIYEGHVAGVGEDYQL